MIRPLTYTYKGRPIASVDNRKSPRNRRRGRKTRSIVLTGFLVILTLAAAASLAWWAFSCFQEGSVPDEAGGNGQASTETEKTPAASSSLPDTGSAPVSQSAALPAPRRNRPEKVTRTARLSEAADRQALQIYSAAASAFQKKDYEKARKALRLLFEKIQLPSGHPLYDRACSMLSDSSMAIYRSGNDPLDWKTHKVERGESLSRIAKKYGTDVKTLTEVNGLSGTSLRIGQTLRIPHGSWRIRVERKNKRLLLDNSGRLFKIYPVTIGPKGESAVTGLYRVRRQQTPDRILFMGSSPSAQAAIHSSEGEPDAGRACFVMKQADVAELLLLIPEKTPAEILK